MIKITNSLLDIAINSDTQWVLKRQGGKGRAAVLWVHGGPGSTLMPFSLAFDSDLLGYFDVIHWDQRASGKSYHSKSPDGLISLKLFAEDLEHLLRVIRDDWGYENVICIGHSWGSVLGLTLASRFNCMMKGFVSVGQVVDDKKAQDLQIKFLKRHFNATDDKVTMAELKRFESSPLSAEGRLTLSALLGTHDGIFGGLDLNTLEKAFKESPFVLPEEEHTQQKSISFLVEKLWPEINAFDFKRVMSTVRVPVLFVNGLRDLATPYCLLEEALSQVAQSPLLIEQAVFPEQGHFPFWEAPERFCETIVTWSIKKLGLKLAAVRV